MATVAVTPSTVSLVIGQTVALTATLRDANGAALSGRQVTWSSTNAAVATVSNQGVVSAQGVGSATITATSEGKTGAAEVTVGPPPVASVVVTPASMTLQTGASGAFLAAAQASGGITIPGKTFVWSSSAPVVATVDQTGVVTALWPGTTSIAASVDGVTGTATLAVTTKPCDCWTTRASIPIGRAYLDVGVINGVLYVVGGFSPSGGYSAALDAYDPTTDTWSAKAPMPTARGAFGVGVVNGILYVIGGEGPATTARVEAYDPATNTWTAKAPMPTPRAVFGVGVVNGVIYAVGGLNDQLTGMATVEAYDPATDSWTTKAPMPTPRGYLGVGVANNTVYAIGGQPTIGTASMTTVEAYDPATNTWTTKAPLPSPRSYLGVGVVNGVVYGVGGIADGSASFSPLGTVLAYAPTTNTWASRAAMPTPRLALAVDAINGVLYAVGGYRGGVPPETRALEAYQP